ncbi:MAG: sugar transferase [Lachnospiraceae bacterium]|nr:sugar transferase [Lachnospiraceae bacterium]
MYSKRKRSWVKHLDFTLLDILCMMLALSIAYVWRFEWNFDLDTNVNVDLYVRMAIMLVLIDIFVIFFVESYSGILRRNKYQELRATILHCFVVFGVYLIYMYATKQSILYSRQLLFTYLVLVIIFEYFARVLWKRVIRRRKLLDKNKSEMIVVAESMTVERCLEEIAHNKYTDFKVVGVVVVDEDMEGQQIQGVPVIANADNFLEYVRTNVVDEVYIDGNTRASSEALATTLVELGVTVHISLVHTNFVMPNTILENYASYVVLTTSMHIASTRQLFFKRLMDIVGSLIGMIITFIAFIIFAPIIKIQSPGPVFFKQVRIGKNGRRFNFYKFRSMYVDAEERKKELMAKNEMDGNMFKMEDDPRIIPIGRFMRKYSIDELPQFFNVLKGDMSLVGTRPPTEDEYEMYKFHHKARLGFKPGLTGMWQISGRSDITDFEEVVAFDTEYICNWNLGLDIKILFKTIGVVFSGKGSK